MLTPNKMKADLIAMRDSIRPTAGGNTDPLMSDYWFWSEIEKITKKERETAKQLCLDASTDPLHPGVVLKSKIYQLVLKATNPIQKFDLEVMIERLLKKFKDRVYIRECAVKAMVDGEPRRSYTVELAE